MFAGNSWLLVTIVCVVSSILVRLDNKRDALLVSRGYALVVIGLGI
jgi:hypothetical protein